MNEELLKMLSEEQKQTIAKLVEQKIIKAVEDIDTNKITEEFEKALLDTDFYYDNIDLDEVKNKLQEITIKALDNILRK